MMKKIFASFAALLLCFQTGIRLNANATEETPEISQEQMIAEIKAFVSENQLNFISCEPTENSILIWTCNFWGADAWYEIGRQMELTENFCQEQGFTENYTIRFEVGYLESLDAMVKAGDTTLNNKIDILDVITLNQAVIGKKKLNVVQKLAADVNQDDKIDAADSLMIMKMIVGLTI